MPSITQGFIGKTRCRKPMLRASLLLLLCWINPLLAAESLTDIAAKLAQPALLQGQFEQKKSIRVLAMPLVSTGTFSVVKNQGVVWQLEKPASAQLIISEDGIKGADLGDNRAMSHVGKILNQLLSGDLAVLEEQFVVSIKENTSDNWALSLVPRSLILQKAIREINLNGDRYIKQLILQEATGDQTIVSFSALVESETLPESIRHVFSKP